MSALGLIAIGLGVLTAWSGFDRTIIFDVLRSFIGAPVQPRSATGGATANPTTTNPVA